MNKKILGALGLFIAPVLLWVGVASAQSFRSGDNVTVRANETVDATLFAAGQTIDVAGDVDGDVFCAGQNITISGDVSGDVICAGQNIRVSGTVDGDIRAAGQSIAIGGAVDGSITVTGQTVTLEGEASVGQDASIASENATLNGPISRDLAVAATSVTVSNSVGRNIEATTEDLNITGNADIGGDVTYTSLNDADIANGAQIAGDTTRQDPPESTGGDGGDVFAFTFGFGIYVLLSFILVALAVVLLFPQALKNTTQRAVDSPAKTLLIGFGINVLAPIAIVAVAITFIGIPLALLLLLLLLVIVFLSGPFSAYYVGRLVFSGQKRSPILLMLVGTLILVLLYFIPFIGFLTMIAVSWMGTGMLASELMRRTPRPVYDANHKAKK